MQPARPAGVALEPVLAVLWGITVPGFVLVRWPLAFLTHALLERQVP